MINYNKEYERAIKYSHNEHDAFFQAKTHNIHDRLPHLVHADMIEEKGAEAVASHIREAVKKNADINRDRPNIVQYPGPELNTFETGYIPANNMFNRKTTAVYVSHTAKNNTGDSDSDYGSHKSITYYKDFDNVDDAIAHHDQLKHEIKHYLNNEQ